ncbi:MAG: two-component sensor histidine kinase [Flavobacteriaceae bacterium]|nr:two-component sensor histidine kinase [Flavobacteriaceae bacterium]
MSANKLTAYPRLIRLVGFLMALGFAGITLWNTYRLIQRIEDDEKQQMELWGLAQQKLASNKDLDNPIDPLTFQILTAENSIPMIVVDNQNNLLFSNNINQRKLAQDSLGYIQQLKEEFGAVHAPIDITYKDSLYQKMYYGRSNLIYQLRYYPFAFLLIVMFIGGLVYAYYKTNRQAVENKLWTGMAKETAHQLGTPISSLLGWLAILEEGVDPKMFNQIKRDVTRLETISARFSKIGSLPNRDKTKISTVVQDIMEYMQIRMPKGITLELHLNGEEKEVSINVDLMSWVLENLIKNSIDAIRGKGKISIELSWDKAALISIQDSGSGIPKKLHRSVFEAGITTKKRGWGLGLALAKRIVAQYHGGKLRLVNSSGSGTCFEIHLPIA